MRDLLRRALVENAVLKGVSLVLAIVLFAVVRNDKDAVSGVYVKVDYDLPHDRVLVSDEPPPEVRLSVRGPSTRVNRLDEEKLDHIRLDLRDGRNRERRFDDSMIKLPSGLRVVSISPSSIHVSFEPRIERTVPIQPVLEGEPAAGYRVVKSFAAPKTVRVSGAKSVVDAIARAPTLPLSIAEARDTVRSPVELSSPPRHAEWHLSHPPVVEVEVAAVLSERVLKGMRVRVTGASRMEAEVEPAQAEVVLRGPTDALAKVEQGVPALLVDAQAEDGRPPGVFRKRISVVGLPVGVAAEVRPESVTLVTRRRRD